ncbi:sugar ABC transporter permease [Paracoccus sp. NBH48]|jgi:ABC-2 type transport system permease protein|uniref:Transport permease protein n=1 Tax=Paracoccus haeundaensis TaxID=225362 RepID=A0A5C4R4B2_9RHOB|nr:MULTISPECIES: ABC transporter permease [unclassified Paracoccus (in: a-proteobacteria)]AZY92308.1 sugar ABC transporter permease [Paracoccus sp. Arc7-R13]QXI62702.1 Inner membrane transport permease YadH [Paracoccus marcusii]TNH38762.1 sugar ABC transporter permease [Paracoccus haeundaensis]TYP68181.1 ABC-2 type transport system permease protein [Stutzerimonas stutzeri]MBF5079800.1 sugar ABC transporter permease [Paracoccus sp. NBH48]|tara:strand:+ start:1981 stop:2748 length:768 start_codon:yes stop_codon:yes gene_type:complete
MSINWFGVWSIFHHEMMRFFRTIWQSLASPVLSTVLYFVVFGAAIGGRIQSVEGVEYAAFIVPGLMMLTVLQQAVSNASFGIYFPKFSGTIYEYLVSPVGWIEVTMGFVGAAAVKSILIALVILLTSFVFVGVHILHPFWMVAFLVLSSIGFSLLGFIIGLWAKSFEQLQIVPMMVIMPLVFLGGAFYSASMLPPFWEGVAKLNPVLYLISGFRWSFFGLADVPVGVSLVAVGIMVVICLAIIRWIFATGWRLRD